MSNKYSNINTSYRILQNINSYADYFIYLHDDFLSLLTHKYTTFHKYKGVFPFFLKMAYITTRYPLSVIKN